MIVSVSALPLHDLIWSAGLVKKKRGSRRKKRERDIINLVTAFDIETSLLSLPPVPDVSHNDHSFMYIWQWAFTDQYVVVGRTWDDWQELTHNIADELRRYQEEKQLEDIPRLVAYVHNLAYEFQFISGVYAFQPEECFFREPRKPIYCRMYDCIEYRCSYIQSNMSLAKFAQTMGCQVQKQSGAEFDYSKKRYPWTRLTDKELEYCIDDVITLVQAITIEMQRDGDDLRTIPLTSTGYVRRDAKKAIWPLRKTMIEKILPDIDQYRILRMAFRGGNCHANKDYAGKIYSNVESYDMTSCYPAQQLTKMFPITKFQFLSEPVTMERVEYLISVGYAVVGIYKFWGLELKDHHEPVPYIPIAKCNGVLQFRTDNGRLLSAGFAEMALTEIDLKIILKQYNFDKIACYRVMLAKKGKLPSLYLDVIKEYYRKKTTLKGAVSDDEQYLYMKSKNKLNSVYGMSAQDPIHQEIKYVDGEYIRSDYDSGKADEALQKANFPYQWGVYTTAYAREALQKGIDLAGHSLIYCDTDSIKTISKVDFSELNARLEKTAVLNGAFADDKKGTRHYCGVFEPDAKYDRFITQGAKRYAYEHGGQIGVTVSGVTQQKNPETGKPFCAEELQTLERFRPGMIWDKAGGTMAVYNDDDNFDYTTEDGRTIHIGKNVAIIPTTYEMTYAKDYEKLLQELVLYTDWRKAHE